MRRSLRLRTRVTLFFAFIALLAGVVLIGVTYGFTRNNLINERKTSAQNQAMVNANDVSDVLTNDPDAVGDFFDTNLRTENGGFANLASDQPGAPIVEITSTDLTHPITDFPQRLIDAVGGGRAATQFVTIDGSDYITVGVAIAEHETGYFEAFPLSSTERTLTAVLTALTLGAAGTLILASLFGLATSRRLLRPLSQVADAAEEIASGGLDTRLAPESDPDLDRLAGSFNEMADAVQTRIEREARFASDVSHELRSPITALTAAVEVLDARRDDIPERTQQALDVVVSQVRRFDDMVIDLLELSRLDAGAPDLNVEELDLVDLTRRIAGRYNAPDVPIDVARTAPTEVAIDKVRYERILGNLIDNAHNHGDGPVRIQIAPWYGERPSGERGNGERREIDRVSIAVEDAGPGVATSEHERIFERFARGSAARNRIGTGLGLALVAEHSVAMGGHAWVEDRPGGGARFVVELPTRVGNWNGSEGAP
ncbi:MAG: HAMP domain-containing sensor histidine kinase [Ilumatobacteraceae bacterium]